MDQMRVSYFSLSLWERDGVRGIFFISDLDVFDGRSIIHFFPEPARFSFTPPDS